MSPPAEPRSTGSSTDPSPTIPFDELEFAILSITHDLSSFRCRDPELTAFLHDDSLINQDHKVSATTLVFWQGELVGFFTLINDCIEREVMQKRDRKHGFRYNHYPAMKIARLATHADYERRGIGTNMISMIYVVYNRLSRYSGCRVITVDAKLDAVEFYKKFGFHEIRSTTRGRAHYQSVDSKLLYLNYTVILDQLQRDQVSLATFEGQESQ